MTKFALRLSFLFLFLPLLSFNILYEKHDASNSWIRINLLGYQPSASKVAIWASKTNQLPQKFELVDLQTGKVVYSSTAIQSFGAYGPFSTTARLNFSDFKTQENT